MARRSGSWARRWWRCGVAAFLTLSLVGGVLADVCPAPEHYRLAQWRRVIDGDTLVLADGTHVRLIGVNAPELAHDGRPVQPFAVAAKRAVQAFLGDDHSLRLVVGNRSHDHYGRLLAHVYRASDGASLEEMLLRRGLAFAIAIGPDVALADCLERSESPARVTGRGVWSVAQFFPDDSGAALRPGFALVQTTITAVVPGRRQWWLETSGDLVLRIATADLGYFDRARLRTLVGKPVRARGWLISRRGSRAVRRGYAPWLLSLHHQADLRAMPAD